MIRTVMVVEDDDAIRMVLRTNLEDEGYRVLEATTAEQGLLIVQDEQPDVVLVDLRLPGIHGLDLVRSLRATSQVPIIIVTAQTDSHDVVAGLEAGADDLAALVLYWGVAALVQVRGRWEGGKVGRKVAGVSRRPKPQITRALFLHRKVKVRPGTSPRV